MTHFLAGFITGFGAAFVVSGLFGVLWWLFHEPETDDPFTGENWP